ncbi:MAG TPA: AraC family transcriptional regulator [Ferruginibacter sp.]|jgi:AraC-like DNA-binding protein|nr:AraC family transcriptional regulator [Ferruginibacter sp.]
MKENYPKQYLYKRVVQAKIFIDAQFSEKVDLDNIADEALFSKFHFIRLFKSMYGSTPHQYLVRVRMEKAKLFLQKGIPAAKTCFAVGFDSVSSFTALFKRHTSLTPSVYQQRYFDRQEQMQQVPLRFIPHCFAEEKGWAKKQVVSPFDK